MKYNPFCSVEISFSNMEGLHELLTSVDHNMKTVVVADAFTTDLWNISDDIKAGINAGNIAWVDKCPPNPTQEDVVRALDIVGDLNPTQIIAIGGGSTIDVGKAISAFYYMFKGKKVTIDMITEALETASYKKTHQFIDIIAIPSTAGTGSEVTRFATIWDIGNKAKYSIDTAENYPKIAMIVPELTLTLPQRGTLSTGIDALSHAVEAFWAKPTTYLVKDVAIRAIDLIMDYLPKTLADPQNLELRTGMLRGALLAGIAFSQTRTTACHSMGYPLTMQYGVEHGFACALTLDAVSKINREKTVFADMLFDTFDKYGGLQNWLDNTSKGIVEMRLSYFGIPKEGIDALVKDTFTKGRMDNNPVDISEEQVKEILLSIF